MTAQKKPRVMGLTDLKTLLKIRKRRNKPITPRIINVTQVDSDGAISASKGAPIPSPEGNIILNEAERKTVRLKRKLKEWASVLNRPTSRKTEKPKKVRVEPIKSQKKREKILSGLKGRWAAKVRGWPIVN